MYRNAMEIAASDNYPKSTHQLKDRAAFAKDSHRCQHFPCCLGDRTNFETIGNDEFSFLIDDDYSESESSGVCSIDLQELQNSTLMQLHRLNQSLGVSQRNQTTSPNASQSDFVTVDQSSKPNSPDQTQRRLAVNWNITRQAVKPHYAWQQRIWHRPYDPSQYAWASDSDVVDQVFDSIYDEQSASTQSSSTSNEQSPSRQRPYSFHDFKSSQRIGQDNRLASKDSARVCMLTNKEFGKNTPGPGAYNLGSCFQHTFSGASVNGRQNTNQPERMPGPGDYNTQTRYFEKNSTKGAVIVGRHCRFRGSKQPGPADYHTSKQALTARDRRAPSATLIGRTKEKLSNKPGPADYITEGRSDSRTRRAANALIVPRNVYSIIDHAGPGVGKYNISEAEQYLNGQSHAVLTGRPIVRRSQTQPGPADYLSENHYSSVGLGPKAVLTSRPKIQKVVDAPAPNTYCVNEDYPRHKCSAIVTSRINIGPKGFKKSKIPGPGEYNIAHPVETRGAFLVGKPESHKSESLPGPADYQLSAANSKGVRKGVSFGKAPTRSSSKLDKEAHLMPGPGQYDTSTWSMLRQRTACAQIVGLPRVRQPELTPGPQSYDAQAGIGSNKHGIPFTSRFEQNPRFSTPGPGTYLVENFAAQKTSGAILSGRISSSKISDHPGPGQYEITVLETNRAQGAFICGKPKAGKLADGPGPNAYTTRDPRDVQKTSKGTHFSSRRDGRLYSETPGPAPVIRDDKSMNQLSGRSSALLRRQSIRKRHQTKPFQKGIKSIPDQPRQKNSLSLERNDIVEAISTERLEAHLQPASQSQSQQCVNERSQDNRYNIEDNREMQKQKKIVSPKQFEADKTKIQQEQEILNLPGQMEQLQDIHHVHEDVEQQQCTKNSQEVEQLKIAKHKQEEDNQLQDTEEPRKIIHTDLHEQKILRQSKESEHCGAEENLNCESNYPLFSGQNMKQIATNQSHIKFPFQRNYKETTSTGLISNLNQTDSGNNKGQLKEVSIKQPRSEKIEISSYHSHEHRPNQTPKIPNSIPTPAGRLRSMSQGLAKIDVLNKMRLNDTQPTENSDMKESDSLEQSTAQPKLRATVKNIKNMNSSIVQQRTNVMNGTQGGNHVSHKAKPHPYWKTPHVYTRSTSKPQRNISEVKNAPVGRLTPRALQKVGGSFSRGQKSSYEQVYRWLESLPISMSDDGSNVDLSSLEDGLFASSSSATPLKTASEDLLSAHVPSVLYETRTNIALKSPNHVLKEGSANTESVGLQVGERIESVKSCKDKVNNDTGFSEQFSDDLNHNNMPWNEISNNQLLEAVENRHIIPKDTFLSAIEEVTETDSSKHNNPIQPFPKHTDCYRLSPRISETPKMLQTGSTLPTDKTNRTADSLERFLHLEKQLSHRFLQSGSEIGVDDGIAVIEMDKNSNGNIFEIPSNYTKNNLSCDISEKDSTGVVTTNDLSVLLQRPQRQNRHISTEKISANRRFSNTDKTQVFKPEPWSLSSPSSTTSME